MIIPTRILTTLGFALVRLNIGEPHFAQNSRSWPGDDSKLVRNSNPERTVTADAGNSALAEKAEPLARRHIEQWQSSIGPGSREIATEILPQRQRPAYLTGTRPSPIMGPYDQVERPCSTAISGAVDHSRLLQTNIGEPPASATV